MSRSERDLTGDPADGSPRRSSSSSSSTRRSSGRSSHGHRRHHHRRSPEQEGVDGWRGWVTFDGVAEGLLYAVLAFSPLAFGAVEAWSREVFLLLVAAAAVTVAAKHVVGAWTGRGEPFRWSWTYLLVLAFLGLCLAQVVPLPAAWVRAVSPETVRLKSELLAGVPGATLARVAISFYPHATVGQAVLVAAVGALFAVVLDVYRDADRIRRLLSVIAGVGLVVAGIAAYQNLTGATTVYGVVPMAHRNAGPFLNYSHFSQFMNLSVGAALALLLERLAELAVFYRTPGELLAAVWEPRNAAVWAWATLCVAGPVVVLLSMSRMGMISLGVATVVSGAMLFWRGRSADGGGADARVWVLGGLGLAVFAVLLFVGFDIVSSRLATVHDLQTAGGGRQEMLRDMRVEFRQFPVLGTGLGTHEYVFGMYDRRDLPTHATHAENEYAQLMEETGVAGVALAAAFLAGLVVCYVRATRRPAEPGDYVPFGLGLGLIAILAHSGTDFGQHVPADAALTAVYAALLTGLARRGRPAAPAGSPVVAPVARRAGPLVGSLAVASATAVAAVGVGLWANRARAAESSWATTQARAGELAAAGWAGTDADFAHLLTPAVAAVARDPANVDYRYWADVYRFRAIAALFDPVTNRPVPAAPPGTLATAAAIADDLERIALLCPTFGPSLGLAGQIDRQLLGQTERGFAQVRLGYRLAAYDRDTCLTAGEDAVDAHQWDAAAAIFDHYAKLGGGVEDYADTCIAAGHPEIPWAIVQHDWRRLLYLAGRMPADDPRAAGWAGRCRAQAATLLAADAARPDAPADTVAEQAASLASAGRPADAADLYRRALASDYGNVDWRLRLARCLSDLDRPADAARQARLCLQLRPGMAEAAALVTACDARARGAP